MNTMQEEFDAVVAHLYKQGKPAVNEIGECVYQSVDGLMCAVGCRIPDAMYDDVMEGESIASLTGCFTLPVEVEVYEDLFRSLQYAHDSWARHGTTTLLDEELGKVAARYNLTYNSPWSAK